MLTCSGHPQRQGQQCRLSPALHAGCYPGTAAPPWWGHTVLGEAGRSGGHDDSHMVTLPACLPVTYAKTIAIYTFSSCIHTYCYNIYMPYHDIYVYTATIHIFIFSLLAVLEVKDTQTAGTRACLPVTNVGSIKGYSVVGTRLCDRNWCDCKTCWS